MPNRTLLIAGNWKMNNDVAEAAKLADELAQALPEVPAGVEVLVCPPTIDITTVHDRIQAAPIALGAQNVYWEAKGAFTGESSCDMLKSAGCTYCIIGHSERRDYFHETDEDQNKKAKALVAAGLVPVFCCGESLEVREAVDDALSKVVPAILAKGGFALITADHGNADHMFDVASDGSKHPFTAHTTNRVPFIIVDEKAQLTGIEDGRLSDIAPTMLTMAGIEPSAEMTGRVLATEA